AFALEPQRLAGIGAGRDGERHRPRWRRNLDARPFDRLEQRDVQIHVHVLAVAAEKGVRTPIEFDQGVAGWTALHARAALARKAQHLAAFDAGGNGDVERASLGKRNAPLCADDRIEKIDVRGEADVASAHARVAAPAADAGAEQIRKDVAEI